MRTRPAIRSVTAILCRECNLRCGYCYQRPRGSLRMGWPVLRASLDLALESTLRPVTIEFSGGEPLLALPMLRRALRYVQQANARGVRCALTTNGTLLGRPGVGKLLATNRVQVRLSYHALPESTDRYGRSVFRRLDDVLDGMRAADDASWLERLHVTVTVGTRELPALADTIEYLVSKGVRHIGMSAAFGEDGWRTEDISEVRRQFARISRLMRRERARTGRIPCTVYRARDGQSSSREGESRVCGGAAGRAITVDPTGQAYGCVMLAGTHAFDGDGAGGGRRRAPSRFVVEDDSPLRTFFLGDVRAPDLSTRLRSYPGAVLGTGMFGARRGQHSVYARCRDCRFIDRCTVCPVTCVFGRRTADPTAVPDFVCAFNRVAFSAAERFAR